MRGLPLRIIKGDKSGFNQRYANTIPASRDDKAENQNILVSVKNYGSINYWHFYKSMLYGKCTLLKQPSI